MKTNSYTHKTCIDLLGTDCDLDAAYADADGKTQPMLDKECPTEERSESAPTGWRVQSSTVPNRYIAALLTPKAGLIEDHMGFQDSAKSTSTTTAAVGGGALQMRSYARRIVICFLHMNVCFTYYS